MNMASTLFTSLSSNCFSFPPRTSTPSSLIPTSSKSLPRCFSSFNFHSYSSSIVSEIDHQLNTILAMRYPETLHQSMQNSVLNNLSSHDHFLPILSVASCELVGGEHASIIPTACAIRIARAASLLHDEQLFNSHSSIPDQRMAVLTGEALFFRSFECVVSFTPPGLVPEFIIQQVVAEISRAVGSTGVAGGQSLIVSGEKEMIWMLRRKFGAMAECSAVCGGLVGGAGDDVVGRLRKYGMAVGILHQVMDEILLRDEDSDERETLLGVVGIERTMEMVEELKSEATRELDILEEKYGERTMPLRCMLDLKTY